MNNLRKAADNLNKAAPPGERLAYVNPNEERLLKAVGGSGKPSSGGVPSYKKGDVEAPPPRDYAKETKETLEAQIKLAPDLYRSETSQEYGRPAYARSEQEMLSHALTGERGAGEQGLLSLYEKYIAPSLSRQQKEATIGEIDMLRELGPQFMEAQRAADPGSENLRLGLQRKAQEGLDAGQGLTQEELAGISESVRSGQSARGTAYQRSQPAMIEETMARMGAGRQAEEQRIQRASQILGQTGQTDAFMALTGRTARVPGQVAGQMGTAGFALQSGPQLFNPESAYAGALAGSNQSNLMNARMASAANKAAITGGLVSGISSMAGGHFMGQAMKGG